MAGLTRPDDAPAGLLISDRHTIRCHAAPDIGLLIRTAVSMSFPLGRASRHVRCLTCSGGDHSWPRPEPWLNCNRCRGTTRFRTSGKIRVNASGKRVDAWLIYRCTSCDNTWNCPVLERRPVSTIDPHLLASLQTNDPDLSRRLAFEKLRRKLKVEHFDDATVRKEVVSEGARPADRLEIVCVVPETTGLRVDRLLSTELRLSRSRIQNMQDAGQLAACPDGLRKPLRHGLQVRIELRGVHDGDKIALAATATHL